MNRSFEQAGRGFSCYSTTSLDVLTMDSAESWGRVIVSVVPVKGNPVAQCASLNSELKTMVAFNV